MMLKKKLVAAMLMVVPLHANADVNARDVYGISLGMTLEEAKEALTERMPDAEIYENNPGRVTFKTDNENMTLMSAHTEGFPVTRIEREVDYMSAGRMLGDPVDLEATLDAYRNKYGEPDDSYSRGSSQSSIHVLQYMDLNDAAPERLGLNSVSFDSLYRNGSFDPAEVDGVDTYLYINLSEDPDVQGYVRSMDVVLTDVATQRAFIYDAIEKQQQAQEEAAQQLRDSSTTPDI